MKIFGQRFLDWKQGLIFSIYAVDQAKLFIDGCGGPTQAFVVRKNGLPYSLLDSEIQEIETQLNVSEKAMGRMIYYFTRERSDVATLQDKTFEFVETLRRIAEKCQSLRDAPSYER